MHVRNSLNVQQELLYQRNPITVVTIIAEYHGTIYSECGLAKCNKVDQWDPMTGVRVAKRRALRKIEEVISIDEKIANIKQALYQKYAASYSKDSVDRVFQGLGLC